MTSIEKRATIAPIGVESHLYTSSREDVVACQGGAPAATVATPRSKSPPCMGMIYLSGR